MIYWTDRLRSFTLLNMKRHRSHRLSLYALTFWHSISFCFAVDAASVSQPPGVVEFKNGSFGFRIERTNAIIKWNGTEGVGQLSIRECNQKLIDSFWDELVKTAASVHNKPPAGKHSYAVVSFNKVSANVFDFEPAFQKLVRSERKLAVMRTESVRRCGR